MKHKLFIIIALVLLLSGCDRKDGPLYKAMEDIEASWSHEELRKFAEKSENDALSDVHFGYAMSFRNNVLRNSKDSSLVKYFNDMDIYHLDDMSGLVFTSLHRKLNDKSIDLKGQLEPLYKYWAEVKKCEELNLIRASKYYENYNNGDTVKVRMPIRNNRTAVRFECPDESDWIYDDTKDMVIEGIIKEKNKTDSLKLLFKIKVLTMNHDSMQVLMEDVNVGDFIEIDLLHDIVENNQ